MNTWNELLYGLFFENKAGLTESTFVLIYKHDLDNKKGNILLVYEYDI